jgi:hypothetical protein
LADLPVKREGDGKFAVGTSGNPKGRPLGKKAQIDVLKQDLELAVRRAVSPERITSIVNKILDEAEKGSVKAAKLIFDTFLTKASTETEGDQGGKGITIRIENATFAAVAANKDEKPAIDGQFQEVTEKTNG